MSQHEIASRAHHWAIATLAGVILLALLAHVQTKDAADHKAAQVQVQKQIRGESK